MRIQSSHNAMLYPTSTTPASAPRALPARVPSVERATPVPQRRSDSDQRPSDDVRTLRKMPNVPLRAQQALSVYRDLAPSSPQHMAAQLVGVDVYA